MSDGFEERRKALEEGYFEKENNQKLENLLNKKLETRLSPITGKPMVREVIDGVTIDRCADSKGIWLDAGELEQLMKNAIVKEKENSEGWISTYLGQFFYPR